MATEKLPLFNKVHLKTATKCQTLHSKARPRDVTISNFVLLLSVSQGAEGLPGLAGPAGPDGPPVSAVINKYIVESQMHFATCEEKALTREHLHL